ncbi:hypothetical protein KC345_g112 [Hortaea werneckii]|nr:hypothetical protein KC345_g112 [Hortaea werneckii]
MGRGTDIENSVISTLPSFEEQLGRKLFFSNNAIFFYVMVSLGHPVDLLSISSGLVTGVINLHARFKFIRASCSVLLLFLVKPVSVIIDPSSQYGSNCTLKFQENAEPGQQQGCPRPCLKVSATRKCNRSVCGLLIVRRASTRVCTLALEISSGTHGATIGVFRVVLSAALSRGREASDRRVLWWRLVGDLRCIRVSAILLGACACVGAHHVVQVARRKVRSTLWRASNHSGEESASSQVERDAGLYAQVLAHRARSQRQPERAAPSHASQRWGSNSRHRNEPYLVGRTGYSLRAGSTLTVRCRMAASSGIAWLEKSQGVWQLEKLAQSLRPCRYQRRWVDRSSWPPHVRLRIRMSCLHYPYPWSDLMHSWVVWGKCVPCPGRAYQKRDTSSGDALFRAAGRHCSISNALTSLVGRGLATLSQIETRFNSPDTFQVHRPNLYNVARLLALQNTIATSTRHSSNIEKLRAVDHMVVLASCNANSVRFDLKAKTAFIFPKGSRHPWLHSRRRDLASCVKRALKLLPRPRCWLTSASHGWEWQLRLRHHLTTH